MTSKSRRVVKVILVILAGLFFGALAVFGNEGSASANALSHASVHRAAYTLIVSRPGGQY
jgi:hypothetical protein